MIAIARFARSVARFFIVWFVETISLLITAWFVPGISIQPVELSSKLVVAIASTLMLGIVNLLIRPLLLLIAVPLGWMVVFLAGFFINAITLMITSSLIPALQIDNWWAAFLGGLFLALVNTVLMTLLNIDDDNSFYDNLIQRQAVRFSRDADKDSGRGLVILETDGLELPAHPESHRRRLYADLETDDGGRWLPAFTCGLRHTAHHACLPGGHLAGQQHQHPRFSLAG